MHLKKIYSFIMIWNRLYINEVKLYNNLQELLKKMIYITNLKKMINFIERIIILKPNARYEPDEHL